jgi:outer membrane protein assembly factor BamB
MPKRRDDAPGRSRREVVGGIGLAILPVPLTGCLGGTGSPEHPGGTVVVENQADANSGAWFKPADDSKQPESMTVAPGESKSVEEYVTAPEGEAVSLVGRLGEFGTEAANKTVEIYPRGSSGTPPQVARMTITNAVAGEWEWSTEPGAVPQTQQDKDISGVPMMGYEPARTGHAAEEAGPTGSVTDEWYYESRGMVSSYPAVVNNSIYYVGRKGGVYAKDASAGSENWKFEMGGSANESSPAVVDGTVYVGSLNGTVYALSASDGTEEWSFDTGESVYSSPAVTDNRVYITTGKTGGGQGNLYALNAADGTEQWRYETGEFIISSPALADGTVYFGNRGNRVYAVSASDGTEQWSFETEKRVKATPAVADGTVYVGDDSGNLYALSASEGTERWSYEADGTVDSSAAVADGTVYFGAQKLNALSASDGSENWSFETEGGVGTSPTVADGTVYFGGNQSVYAVSVSDGTERWSLDVGGAVNSVVVADEIVYVGMLSAPRGVRALTA